MHSLRTASWSLGGSRLKDSVLAALALTLSQKMRKSMAKIAIVTIMDQFIGQNVPKKSCFWSQNLNKTHFYIVFSNLAVLKMAFWGYI